MRSWATLKNRNAMALGAIGLLMLSGCAATDTGNASGGEGVPLGATKEEYIEAFAEVEPITLQSQIFAETPINQMVVEYSNALEEWSGGKISVDMAIGDVIAPGDEYPAALNDGRMDFGATVINDSARYPAYAALSELTFQGSTDPVTGVLETSAALESVASQTPEIQDEAAVEGMHYVLNVTPSGPAALGCTEQISDDGDIHGAQIRTAMPGQTEQVRGLNANPVVLGYGELYEAMQRGVVNCISSGIGTMVGTGTFDVVKDMTLFPEARMDETIFPLAWSKSTWDSLPLVAQQLAYDRADVWLETKINEDIWGTAAEATQELLARGGAVHDASESLDAALGAINEERLAEAEANGGVGEDIAALLPEALAEWDSSFDDSGIESYTNWNEFLTEYQPEEGVGDLSAFFEVWHEARSDQRPN